MIPDEGELIELRNWFESVAEELSGRYDGWEAAVTGTTGTTTLLKIPLSSSGVVLKDYLKSRVLDGYLA